MQTAPSLHQVPLLGVGTIRYAVAGSGPPVVLLHGLGGSWPVWRPTIPVLALACSVYAPDLPGHGASDKPRMAHTLESGAAFTVGFMDALGLARATLVGNSLGGLLALATALEHPSRVAALVLASPAGLGRELARPLRWASAPLVGPLLAALEIGLSGGLLHQLFHRPGDIDRGLLKEILTNAAGPGVRRTVLSTLRHGVDLRGLRPGMVLLERMGQLRCPTLVVWGQEDRVIPVAHAHLVHKYLPGAQVHVLRECGHLPQMEKAPEFNGLVATFLRQALAASRERGPA